MKKTPLLAATAVLTVLLATGFAQAKTTTETAVAPATTATAPAAGMHKMKGHMMGSPKFSEATQKVMQESMNKVREDNKSTFDDMEAKHKELQEILKAPTFDKAAFTSKHEEILTLRQKLDAARTESMANVMEKMTAEERAQMGGMGMGMGKGMHHMGKRGGAIGDCPMMDRGDDTPAAPAVNKKK